MATLTRGYTFGATEQVTNTKLHTLMDGGSVTSIAQSDLVASEGLVHRGTSAPSDTDQLWADTSLTPVILKVYDGTNWVPTDELNILTNSSGVSLVAGSVVIMDTANSERVKTTSTQGDVKWRGIAVATVANSSSGVFKTHGYVPNVLLETSASAGCFLACSTATGKAVQVASGTAGIFAMVTSSGTASAGAYLFSAAFQSGATTSAASQAEMEAATNTTNPVTPGRAQYHPGVAKGWVAFNGTGTVAITASYNVTSITDGGVGIYAVNWTTAFSSANYSVGGVAQFTSVHNWIDINTLTTTAANIYVADGAALRDSAIVCIQAFGDQ